MKEIAGETFTNWIDDAAVVGLWKWSHYGYFRKSSRRHCRKSTHSNRSGSATTIGFTSGFAHAAAYVKYLLHQSQVWAWYPGALKMARYLDLCSYFSSS